MDWQASVAAHQPVRVSAAASRTLQQRHDGHHGVDEDAFLPHQEHVPHLTREDKVVAPGKARALLAAAVRHHRHLAAAYPDERGERQARDIEAGEAFHRIHGRKALLLDLAERYETPRGPRSRRYVSHRRARRGLPACLPQALVRRTRCRRKLGSRSSMARSSSRSVSNSADDCGCMLARARCAHAMHPRQPIATAQARGAPQPTTRAGRTTP